MSLVAARRNVSVRTRKGQAACTPPSPANFVNHDKAKDTRTNWRTQYLMERHHVSPSLGDLISSLLYGEARDAC